LFPAVALRLASWEKARLEEIYTGHLLRMSLSENDICKFIKIVHSELNVIHAAGKEPATTLVKGKLEGQVKVRIAGQTDWKPLWMVLSSSSDGDIVAQRPNSPLSMRSKNRMSNLFSRVQPQAPPGPAVPVISFYQKPKDRKPLLTMRYVSQVQFWASLLSTLSSDLDTKAFAVYPERPEVIQKSTLIKVEGLVGHEDLAGTMKGKECWLMIMPETQQAYPVFELLKWLVGKNFMTALL
jgi:CCR4-NOT transcriptional complex subunit CAF120